MKKTHTAVFLTAEHCSKNTRHSIVCGSFFIICLPMVLFGLLTTVCWFWFIFKWLEFCIKLLFNHRRIFLWIAFSFLYSYIFGLNRCFLSSHRRGCPVHRANPTATKNPPIPTSPSPQWQSGAPPKKCYPYPKFTVSSPIVFPTIEKTPNDGKTPLDTICPLTIALSRSLEGPIGPERGLIGRSTPPLSICSRMVACWEGGRDLNCWRAIRRC